MTPEPVDENARWTFRVSLLILGLCVMAMVYLSEALVGTIEPVLNSSGLSALFVGVIVIPIIGNAAEHAASIQVAYRNQMELALGISMGSSMQVAVDMKSGELQFESPPVLREKLERAWRE